MQNEDLRQGKQNDQTRTEPFGNQLFGEGNPKISNLRHQLLAVIAAVCRQKDILLGEHGQVDSEKKQKQNWLDIPVDESFVVNRREGFTQSAAPAQQRLQRKTWCPTLSSVQ